MNESINIAVDLETLSTRPTAAIISIAAKAFTFSDPQPEIGCFYVPVNATTCAMYGMHFSESTVDFWYHQKEEAKKPHLELSDAVCSLKVALLKLKDWVDSVRAMSPDKKLLVWMQGTDFDGAILRNAYCQVFGSEEAMPWKFTELRDSRTFIHGFVGYVRPDLPIPYDAIPENPNWIKHDALSDCDQLIWNVRHCVTLMDEYVTSSIAAANL